MENLIVWVYLADVLPSMGGVLGVLGFLMAIAAVSTTIALITGGVKHDLKRVSAARNKMAVAMLAFWLLATAMPSKQTIYTMIGLSIGAELAATPTAEKAMRVLNQELDKYLESAE